MKSKYLNTIVFTLLMLIQGCILVSCKKFIEVDNPNDQLNSDEVFSDSSTATSAVIGIYSEMLAGRNIFSNSSVTLYAGMSSDELYYYTPELFNEFTRNQITQQNHINIDNSFWKPAYRFIYAANLCIEKLEKSENLPVLLNNQLTGEAKFIRAFCYFHLINLFGDVPLITTVRYQNNARLPRTAVSDIYSQIIKDLEEAKTLLGVEYVTSQRVRPNRWTASALLSRCFLYTGRWQEAELEADAIINSGNFFLEPDLNNVFLNSSREAIWQLMPVRPGFNTYEGLEFLPSSPFSYPTYLIAPSLHDSFESNDLRKSSWITSRVFNSDTLYYPFKYKLPNSASLTEYYMIFRLAEQYLIRSEAALKQDRIGDARADVDILRSRAGLAGTLAHDPQSMALAIEQERRAELFCEWGHRWYDLKRTGRATDVLAPLKGATWQNTDVLWPVPQQEINLNPALTQNSGY